MKKPVFAAVGIGLAAAIGLLLARESPGLAQTKDPLPRELSAPATVAPVKPAPVNIVVPLQTPMAGQSPAPDASNGTWTGVATVAAPQPAKTDAPAANDTADPSPISSAPAAPTPLAAPTAARPSPVAAPGAVLAQSKTTPADVLSKAGGALPKTGGKPAAPAAAPAPLRAGSALPTPLERPVAFGQATGDGTIVLERSRGRVVRLPRPAATVFIANPEIADVQVKSPNLVYVFAKKGGETTLIAVDGDDEVMLESRVVVTGNQDSLRESLKALLPDRDIAISSVGEQVVLEGRVGSPTDIENARRLAAAITGDDKKVINRLKVATSLQVMLRVRVAEMSKDVSKNLGFNWQILRDAAGLTSLQFAFAQVNPNSQAIANKIGFTAHTGPWDVNSVIDAMEDERLVKILAQPNLTALSGQTASFLVGGEFPILVPQSNTSVTVEFKTFGVSLAFQPTVLDGNRISLHVRPEVSELSDQGAVNLLGIIIPALQVRRAETTVEVGSGQSFALAGLLRNDVTHSVSKWPGLADIPILGTLFRSDQFQRKETELIIIVTPYLVEPTSSTQLASPTDGFNPPHDVDRIFFGAQWKREAVPGTTAPNPTRQRLAGPAGFQLE